MRASTAGARSGRPGIRWGFTTALVRTTTVRPPKPNGSHSVLPPTAANPTRPQLGRGQLPKMRPPRGHATRATAGPVGPAVDRQYVQWLFGEAPWCPVVVTDAVMDGLGVAVEELVYQLVELIDVAGV
jgi:hypothetical protein